MAVKARRDGTVIYKQDWRGDKKTAGDSVWRGETPVEIASIQHMAAQGQVHEVDGSQVAVGQRVGLRLEASPDKEYRGVVEQVASLVQTESPESQIRVVRLDIKLLDTDTLLMRPGSRFRGRIEIARVKGVLQVPLSAIESAPGGPVVHKAQSPSPPVKLGRRARDAVEVIEGLSPGDRVLLRAGPGEGAKGQNAMRLGAS
jgi:hypothetical protein